MGGHQEGGTPRATLSRAPRPAGPCFPCPRARRVDLGPPRPILVAGMGAGEERTLSWPCPHFSSRCFRRNARHALTHSCSISLGILSKNCLRNVCFIESYQRWISAPSGRCRFDARGGTESGFPRTQVPGTWRLWPPRNAQCHSFKGQVLPWTEPLTCGHTQSALCGCPLEPGGASQTEGFGLGDPKPESQPLLPGHQGGSLGWLVYLQPLSGVCTPLPVPGLAPKSRQALITLLLVNAK